MVHVELLQHIPPNPKSYPLLLVHGAWHGAWCWADTFMPRFAQADYATYALSLRGHGGSGGALRWASTANFVDDIAQVVEKIQHQHQQLPVLIGHSMGGYLVQKYLETHTAPAAILLASLPARGALPFFLRYIRRHPLTFLLTCLTLTPYHFVRTPARAKELFFSPDFPDQDLAAIHPQLGNESFRAVLDTGLFNLPRPAKVNAQNIPLLVLGGERDAIFPPHDIHATAQAYGITATIYPQMAHNLMTEQGWEQVAQDILNWLGDKLS